jgi:hypothetical protein
MSAPEHVLTVARGTGEGQQSVSVSGTSAATSNAIGADECVVYANVECFVLAGSNPTATVAAGTPLSAGQTIRLRGIQPGDKLAFITASGTGTAYVRPGA